MNYKDVFAYYGAYQFIKAHDSRALEKLSKKMSDKMEKYFGSLDANVIIASQEKIFLRAFNHLEDVLYNFKPIRLTDGVKLEDFVTDKHTDEAFTKRFKGRIEPRDRQEDLEYSKFNLGRFVFLAKKEDVAFQMELLATIKAKKRAETKQMRKEKPREEERDLVDINMAFLRHRPENNCDDEDTTI